MSSVNATDCAQAVQLVSTCLLDRCPQLARPLRQVGMDMACVLGSCTMAPRSAGFVLQVHFATHYDEVFDVAFKAAASWCWSGIRLSTTTLDYIRASRTALPLLG